MRTKKALIIFSLLLIILVSTGKAQSDALMTDDVRFEDGRVTHNLTAYADLKDVKVIDMYVSDVSQYRTNFLGDSYYLVNRSIGDMERGENKEISYNIQFNDYALLGASTFIYEGEDHRLSPKRTEAEKRSNLVLWLAIFSFLTLIYLLFDFIRSRP